MKKSKKDERYLNPAATPGFWRADDTVYCCAKCQTGFSSITRQHHCRRCGDIFCSRCANHFVAKIRFCDGCVEDLFTFLTRKEDAEEMPETTTLNPAALSERDSQALQERCESMERDLATTKQELCKTKDNNSKLIAIIQEQDLKRHKSRRQWCTGFKCLAGTSGVTTIVAVACIVVPSGPVGWFFGAVGAAAKTFGGLSAASAVAATLLRGKGKSDAHTLTDFDSHDDAAASGGGDDDGDVGGADPVTEQLWLNGGIGREMVEGEGAVAAAHAEPGGGGSIWSVNPQFGLQPSADLLSVGFEHTDEHGQYIRVPPRSSPYIVPEGRRMRCVGSDMEQIAGTRWTTSSMQGHGVSEQQAMAQLLAISQQQQQTLDLSGSGSVATPCPDDFMLANFPAEQQQNQERITQIQADMVQVRDLWAEFARLVRVQQPGITAFSQHVQSAQNHADRGLNHVRQAAEEVAEEA